MCLGIIPYWHAICYAMESDRLVFGQGQPEFLNGPQETGWARVMTRKRSVEKKKEKETAWEEQEEEIEYIEYMERDKKDSGVRRHRSNPEDTAPKR